MATQDKIIDAEDILDAAHDCIECICLAAETLDKLKRGPVLRVADIASKKIGEAIALLEEFRRIDDAKPTSPAV